MSNTISVSHAVHACLAVTLLVSLVEHMSSQAVCICRCFTSVAAMLYQRTKMWNRTCFPFQNTSSLFRSSCSSIFSFLCSDCRSLYVLFSLVILLSVIRFITSDYPASTLRIHNVAVWLLFGQVPFLRENYVATTYFRYVICKSL